MYGRRYSEGLHQAIEAKEGVKVDNLTVFVPAQVAGSVSYAKGQNVTLYGTVQTYRGEKEILVGASGDISLLP